jgi:hypothetical protein
VIIKKSHLTVLKRELLDFLKSAKKDIGKYDLIVTGDGLKPGFDFTFGFKITDDGISWNYQTGDNSFTGGAYGFPIWVTACLMRRTNLKQLVNDIVDDLQNQVCWQ